MKRAAVYDVVKSRSESRLRQEVEEKYSDYKVVAEFLDLEVNIERYGIAPRLTDMLNKIVNGYLKIDALFVKNVDVFRRVEVFLGVKRILELMGIKLISLRGRDSGITERSLNDLLKLLKRRDFIDLGFFLFIIAMGVIFILITKNLLYAIIIGLTIALLAYTHNRKALSRRRRMRKIIIELLKIKLKPGRSEVRISRKGVEIRELG